MFFPVAELLDAALEEEGSTLIARKVGEAVQNTFGAVVGAIDIPFGERSVCLPLANSLSREHMTLSLILYRRYIKLLLILQTGHFKREGSLHSYVFTHNTWEPVALCYLLQHDFNCIFFLCDQA